MPYCMYLRKSRQDLEAEANGQGETLSRHYDTLMSFAHSLGITIAPDAVYREIVSGDTISERSVFQRVLQEVQAGMWDGVFCMAADRLSRGDSIDQGIVAQTFKYSGTKIMTPYKVYDPDSEIDEEFFEFSLFMSRREYKTINRRLQAGRAASVTAGNFVSGKRPYGYEVVKRRGAKGYTLSPIPSEADVVRQIFSWFLDDLLQPSEIAKRLNSLGIPNYSGQPWTKSGTSALLRNPIYAGYVQWLKRETRKTMVDGVRTSIRPLSDRHIMVKGVHDPLITDEMHQRACTLMHDRRLSPRVPNKQTLKNPLAGLLRCAHCGYGMTRSISKSGIYYKCRTIGCSNHGTRDYIVIESVLDALRSWITIYSSPQLPSAVPISPDNSNAINLARTALSNAEKQLNTARDMLERGVYSVDEFLQRRELLSQKIDQARMQIQSLELSQPKRSTEEIIRANLPKIQHVLDAWDSCATPEEQNNLLRTVISSIVLQKDTVCHRNQDPREHLSLTLYPLAND